MKILFITPGSGDGYYCGNCFRDNLQAQALQRAGHDVVMIPLYLPLKHIGSLQGNAPLFFPATTYYVDQKVFGNHKMPDWLKRLLGSDKILDLASVMSGTTSSAGMEDMTLSMMVGEGKAFDEHVSQLITWINEVEHPDVIQLSSSLLIGIAKAIKHAMDVPIVCSLQDEEVWIDGLKPIYVTKAWKSVIDNASYIDSFITTSEYYRQVVINKLPALGKVGGIYPGVNAERYHTDEWPADPTIGFFYRMNELDGLDILADAFVLLKQRNAVPRLKLRIGGGYMGPDKSFMAKVRKTLLPYKNDVIIEEDYTWEHHADFYKQISVLSVPLRFQEGVGLYLLEAFAAGRPVVEPATGSFAEIVGDAGLLYEPNEPKALADALEKLLTDNQLFRQCNCQALILAQEKYRDETMATKLLNLYKTIKKK